MGFKKRYSKDHAILVNHKYLLNTFSTIANADILRTHIISVYFFTYFLCLLMVSSFK